MIGRTRYALLTAASLFLATPAVAAQPDGGRYVWVPAGTAAILVPTAPAVLTDFPVASIIAQQDAIMHRMMADMDALMAMPRPIRDR